MPLLKYLPHEICKPKQPNFLPQEIYKPEPEPIRTYTPFGHTNSSSQNQQRNPLLPSSLWPQSVLDSRTTTRSKTGAWKPTSSHRCHYWNHAVDIHQRRHAVSTAPTMSLHAFTGSITTVWLASCDLHHRALSPVNADEPMSPFTWWLQWRFVIALQLLFSFSFLFFSFF